MELSRVQKLFQTEMEKSSRIIDHYFQKEEYAVFRQLIAATPYSSGKRVRLMFLFLLARATGYESNKLYPLAAAVEVFHLASLVHDDILDESKLRRNKMTHFAEFGAKVALLWGDMLLALFQQILLENKLYREQSVFNFAARQMIGGQLNEYFSLKRTDLSLEQVVDIARRKTAALFVAIARLVRARKSWQRFAEDFGLLFQFSDDLLDLFGKNSGKEHYRDLAEGKLTLPYYLLLKELPELRQSFLNADVERLVSVAREQKIEEKTTAFLQNYYRRMERQLKRSVPEPLYSYFNTLCRFLLVRRA